MTPKCVRLLLFLLLCAPVVRADELAPRASSWAVGPGWAASFASGDDRLGVRDFWFAGEFEHNGRSVFTVVEEDFGAGLRARTTIYTWDADGDLCLVGHVAWPDEELFYEPPLKLVDYPLTAGKTWEARARRYDNQQLTGDGNAEHHRFTVGAPTECELPNGPATAFPVYDNNIQGNELGTSWYVPGLGRCRFTATADGAEMSLVELSDDGALSLRGVGLACDLKFAWHEGRDITVDSFTAVEAHGTAGDTTHSRLQYDLRVDGLPDGLLVQPGNFGRPGDTGSTEELLARLGRATPGYVVNRAGEFQGCTRLEATADSLIALARDLSGADARAELIGALAAGLVTPEILTARAAQDWNLMVGLWNGFSGSTRVSQRGELRIPVPGAPDLDLPTVFLLAAAEFCPCTAAGPPDECVRLLYSAATDRREFRTALTALRGQNDELDAQLTGLENLFVRTDIQVVMEPATMYPHDLRYQRTVSPGDGAPGISGAAESGAGPAGQTEFRHLKFTYSDRSGSR